MFKVINILYKRATIYYAVLDTDDFVVDIITQSTLKEYSKQGILIDGVWVLNGKITSTRVQQGIIPRNLMSMPMTEKIIMLKLQSYGANLSLFNPREFDRSCAEAVECILLKDKIISEVPLYRDISIGLFDGKVALAVNGSPYLNNNIGERIMSLNIKHGIVVYNNSFQVSFNNILNE